ncbi:MAG TPA: MBG domain-containing protein, partial [Prosthecobacter sp.]
ISGFFDDLDPQAGQVTWKQMADRVAVTWSAVREVSTSNANSFQIELFFDGYIRITHLGLDATDGLIGLSKGTGVPVDYQPRDFSLYTAGSTAQPSFVLHPSTQSVQAGANVVLTASASGPAPLSYQWFKNDQVIPGAEGASLTLSSAQLADSGSYRVVAANINGGVSSNTGVLTVAKGTATVELQNLAQVFSGSARSVTAVTNPPGLTVNITYDGAGAAPVNAGNYAVVVTVNDANYEGTASGTLTVARASQTLSFAAIADQLATATVNLSAMGGASGEPVVFEVTSGLAQISGGQVLSFTGSGAVSVRASQAGNGNYNAAAPVTRSFTVSQAVATVNVSNGVYTFDGSAKGVMASTVPAGLPVTVFYNGSTTVPVNAGNYAVLALVNHPLYQGTGNGTLTINRASQTLSFAAIADQLATATVNLSAMAGASGEPVVFEVTSGLAQISGGQVLSFTGSGAVSVRASQAGNGNYNAADPVTRSFTVSKAVATVNLSGGPYTFDGSAKGVTVSTVPAELPITILYDGSATVPVNAGDYVVQASVDHALYQGTASGNLVIEKAEQTLQFAALEDRVVTDQVLLSATGGGSGNAVVFSVTGGPGVITNGTLTFTGAGQVSVTASQEGNDNFKAAAPIVRTFNVTRAPAVISLSGTTQYFDGNPRPVTVTTQPAGLEFSLTYNGSGTAPSAEGSYEVQATVDTALYSGSVTGTLTILRPRLVVESGAAVLNPGTSSLEFGKTLPGGTASLTVTVRNGGTGVLANLSASLAGTDAAVFSAAPSLPAQLAAGESAALTISFNPSAEGRRSAQFRVQSSDVSTPVFDVALTGLGDHRADREVTAPEEAAEPVLADSIPWNDSAAGVYDGLLHDTADGGRLVGAIEALTVTKPKAGSGTGGAFSGKLRLPGRTVALKGSLDGEGRLLLNLPQKEGAVTGELQLMSTPAGHALRGALFWQAFQMQADLPRAAYDKTHIASTSLSGAYTMLLPGPDERSASVPGGDGWAVVTVTPTGQANASGRLADGTAFTDSGFVSAEGQFSLFAEIYRTAIKGRVGGRLTLRDVPDTSDFDGRVQWMKFADSRETAYPEGFQQELQALGSRYSKPAAGQRVLAQLEDAEPNASLGLSGGPLPASAQGEIERVISWLPTHKLIHYGPETLTATVNSAQGLLTGSYQAPGGTKISFLGAAFQKQGLAAGYFLAAGGGGALRIVPGTSFVHPGSEGAGDLASAASPDTAAPQVTTTQAGWNDAAAGTFHGVLKTEGGIQGGIENLVLSARRTFTAMLWVQGVRYPVRGEFDASGKAVLSTDGGAVTAELQLTQDGDGAWLISGTVTKDGDSFVVDAQELPVYAKGTSSPQAGSYTLAVLAPEILEVGQPGGDGHALLKVAASGVCTGALTLADGTTATLAGHVSRQGEWSLHRSLYGSTGGYVAGKVAFREVAATSDADGVWHWYKPAGATPKSALFRDAFATERRVIACRYAAPGKNQRGWVALGEHVHNVWLRLTGADVSTLANVQVDELDRVMTWTTANKLIYYGPEKITVTYNPASGLVSGSVVDARKGINQKFAGVLLQKQGLVTGSFQTTSQTGRFVMQRREP